MCLLQAHYKHEIVVNHCVVLLLNSTTEEAYARGSVATSKLVGEGHHFAQHV